MDFFIPMIHIICCYGAIESFLWIDILLPWGRGGGKKMKLLDGTNVMLYFSLTNNFPFLFVGFGVSLRNVVMVAFGSQNVGENWLCAWSQNL